LTLPVDSAHGTPLPGLSAIVSTQILRRCNIFTAKRDSRIAHWSVPALLPWQSVSKVGFPLTVVFQEISIGNSKEIGTVWIQLN